MHLAVKLTPCWFQSFQPADLYAKLIEQLRNHSQQSIHTSRRWAVGEVWPAIIYVGKAGDGGTILTGVQLTKMIWKLQRDCIEILFLSANYVLRFVRAETPRDSG